MKIPSLSALALSMSLALPACAKKEPEREVPEEVVTEISETRERLAVVDDGKYTAALQKLKAADIFVYDEFVVALTQEKGRNDQYIEALLKLNRADIFIDVDFVNALTLEKGTSPQYIDKLLQLHRSDIFINAEFVAAYSMEKSEG
ncbi:MAG: hypothetical protein Q8P68_03530 [Candidatus Peregrinibacteria bacterium]|nr:hypothetical protein [Candidatus Peregrinibacteria bacterium]MDZ4245328.1 hypothetical protein [Candidatus Gracilibacteria bacterium]